MSKQSEAKQRQGYDDKPTPRNCGNCTNFRSDSVHMGNSWNPAGYWEEKNLRCGLGGFAVKKRGICNKFDMKEQDK